MRTIRLRVVPKPEDSRHVVAPIGGPLQSQKGDITYVCGRCGRPLLENAGSLMRPATIFHCGCGAYNTVEQ